MMIKFILVLTLNFSLAKDQVKTDYAYSFSEQKLKPIVYSKSYYSIIIQEHCPACHQVYSLIDAQSSKSKNVYLSSTYEPSKRWVKKHKKYVEMYGLYSAGNLIRKEGDFAKATPALYTWDAKKQVGKIEYGLKAIQKIFKN